MWCPPSVALHMCIWFALQSPEASSEAQLPGWLGNFTETKKRECRWESWGAPPTKPGMLMVGKWLAPSRSLSACLHSKADSGMRQLPPIYRCTAAHRAHKGPT